MVPDINEVIYSLECCKGDKNGCSFCFYKHRGCRDELLTDAQKLLKGQHDTNKCKYCGRDMGNNWAWCAWCGRTVNYK